MSKRKIDRVRLSRLRYIASSWHYSIHTRTVFVTLPSTFFPAFRVLRHGLDPRLAVLDHRSRFERVCRLDDINPPTRLDTPSKPRLGSVSRLCRNRTWLYPLAMPLARVVINLGGLNVKIEQDAAYPDIITDMCNRAAVLFATSLTQATSAGLEIMASTWVDYGDDDEEED